MKHILLALVVLFLAVPLFAAVETWTNVALMDSMCVDKAKANPDAHKLTCLQMCAKHSDIGILTSDGQFLKFDKEGKQKAVAALEKVKKEDHIRATVTGERSGDTIKVKTLAID